MSEGGSARLLLHVCCGQCTASLLVQPAGAAASLLVQPAGAATSPLLLSGCDAASLLVQPAGAATSPLLPSGCDTTSSHAQPAGTATPAAAAGVASFAAVTGLFYNPNIHPEDEFNRRLESAKKLFAHAGTELIIREDYMRREWEDFEASRMEASPSPSDPPGASGIERASASDPPGASGIDGASPSDPPGSSGIDGASPSDLPGASGIDGASAKKCARCEMCYRVRLSYTARFARDAGYAAFSTTLLASPYQDHDLIVKICGEQSMAYRVGFYYRDFKPYFREGRRLARKLGLYSQKYCGCVFSAPAAMA